MVNPELIEVMEAIDKHNAAGQESTARAGQDNPDTLPTPAAPTPRGDK